MKREFYNDSFLASGLHLLNCGFEKCEAPFFSSPEENGSYRVFNVTEGAGTFEADGKEYRAQKGDVFVFRPGVGIRLSSEGEGGLWSLCWIVFGGADAEFYLSEIGLSGLASQKKAENRAFLSAVLKCLDMSEGGEKPSQSQITACLLEALASLRPRKTSRTRHRASEQTDKALRFIEYNYMRGITARDVAAELNIDRTHFFRIFKARTGLSPEQFIMKFRVKKAKELLETSSCTVTETASLVGINDVYYFSKLFKKAEGISPTEYRKKVRGQA